LGGRLGEVLQCLGDLGDDIITPSDVMPVFQIGRAIVGKPGLAGRVLPDPLSIKAKTLPALTEAILKSISDGVFTVDLQWRITSFNRAAEEITGIARDEALGRLCCDVFLSSICASECALRQTRRTGEPVIGKSGYIMDADGSRLPICVSTAVLKDSAGRIIRGAKTLRDMREVQALRRELSGAMAIKTATAKAAAETERVPSDGAACGNSAARTGQARPWGLVFVQNAGMRISTSDGCGVWITDARFAAKP
jgi:PAS domain S-box-containing protein